MMNQLQENENVKIAIPQNIIQFQTETSKPQDQLKNSRQYKSFEGTSVNKKQKRALSKDYNTGQVTEAINSKNKEQKAIDL
jgi:hypothetical protein